MYRHRPLTTSSLKHEKNSFKFLTSACFDLFIYVLSYCSTCLLSAKKVFYFNNRLLFLAFY